MKILSNMGIQMEKNIRFKLNGKTVNVISSPDRMLLWVLRSDLKHTGAKYSCGEGFCGACTVLVDNEPILSCQFPLEGVEGKDVLTIEGLKKTEVSILYKKLSCSTTPSNVDTAPRE